MKALHIHLEGYSAFFKQTGFISGTQMSLPSPGYSTILGMIGACVGGNLSPSCTDIGYEFKSVSRAKELNRTDRFEYKNERLRPQPKGQGLLYQLVHFRPKLDLYLTNLELVNAFKYPVASPTLGRSQDLMWTTIIEEVELEPRNNGHVGATLIQRDKLAKNIQGIMVRAADYFDNTNTGRTRLLGSLGFYIATSQEKRTLVQFKDLAGGLYHPSNFTNNEDVIYIHSLI